MFDNFNPYNKGKKCPENNYCIFFYNYLFEKILSLYNWQGDEFVGPEATLNRDYLEWQLLTQGQALFIKDKEGKLRGLTVTRIGMDCYNFPEMLQSTNAVLGTLSGKINKDCVWIRNNRLATPSIRLIAHYAKQLAQIQLSLDISLRNNRMTKVFTADNDPQAQQIRKLIDDVSSGKEAVIIKETLLDNILKNNKNDIPVYGTPSEYLAANYIQDMRNVMNNFLVAFGIDCSGANVVKKEVNLNSEVISNNQEIMINRQYMLSTRQEACRIANELFGTNLSVDVYMPDIREDVNTNAISKREFSDEQA